MPLRMGRHTHTIAAVVALLGAGGILLFLTIGSGVIAPSAPGLVHTTEIKIAPEIIRLVAREVAQKHLLIPINRAGPALVCAMSDPANTYAVDDLTRTAPPLERFRVPAGYTEASSLLAVIFGRSSIPRPMSSSMPSPSPLPSPR